MIKTNHFSPVKEHMRIKPFFNWRVIADVRRREERMLKQYRFLLIGNVSNDPWQQTIEEIAASLGIFEMADESEALKLTIQQDYDVIFIDAAKVRDAPLLVSFIKAQRENARIVVATASPTWRRARDAFQAGATDYIRKSINKQETLSALRATMDKVPPHRRA